MIDPGRAEMSSLTLTREQAAVLLPLLQPRLQDSTSSPAPATEDVEALPFTVADMLRKKKKNARSTAAQNFLLTIVREAARAANLWDSAPLIRDITPEKYNKFFLTAFTLCPQLKASRHLLHTRLSQTLINRRQFLRRKGKLPCVQHGSTETEEKSPKLPSASTTKENETPKLPSTNETGRKETPELLSATETRGKKTPKLKASVSRSGPCVEVDTSSSGADGVQSSSENLSPGNNFTYSDTVYIYDAKGATIGRGIYLSMNSTDSYEQFGKVLFQSARKNIGDVELPQRSERGKLDFCELERGDIFLWKVCRLQHAANLKVVNHKTTTGYGDSSEEGEEREDEYLSSYEKRRLERIQQNKRKLDEIFAGETPSSSLQPKNKRGRFASTTDNGSCKNLSTLDSMKFEVGQYIAVRSSKYNERPLIGCINHIDDYQKSVQFDWYVGTYSGTWREWKGREGRQRVTFTDSVPFTDVIYTNVTFTKSKRLTPSVVTALKQLY